jgi:hypothetical protein
MKDKQNAPVKVKRTASNRLPSVNALTEENKYLAADNNELLHEIHGVGSLCGAFLLRLAPAATRLHRVDLQVALTELAEDLQNHRAIAVYLEGALHNLGLSFPLSDADVAALAKDVAATVGDLKCRLFKTPTSGKVVRHG